MGDLPVGIDALMLAGVVVFVGTLLQGSVGFGLGTLGVPLLLLIDPVFVPAPTLLLAFCLTTLVYLRDRSAVRTADLGWGIGGRVVGAALAAALLSALPLDALPLLIAALILVALAIMQAGVEVPINRGTLVGVGALSGFMGTTASVGGPPMAMLYQSETGPRVRGTLSGIFIAGTAASLTALAVVNRFGLQEAVLAALLLPAMGAGFAVSRFGARFLDRGHTRTAILIMSGVAAAVTILRHAL